MKAIRPHSFGMVFGLFLGLFHFVWVAMIFTGTAQPFIDFVFRLHMITPLFQIAPFSMGNAVGLVVFTVSFGYITGFVLGAMWNRFVVHSRYGARQKLVTQTS